MNTYHITLSGGVRHDVRANSAGVAIAVAIRDHPGREAIECFIGCKEAHFVSTVNGIVSVPAGWTDFDIPSHRDLINDSAQLELPLGTTLEETTAFDFFADVPIAERPKKHRRPHGVGIKEKTNRS